MMNDWAALLSDPISIPAALGFAMDAQAGGMALFVGTTRAETNSAGQALVALDYEAYVEMARTQLEELARRARQRWPIVKLVLLHRTGRVTIGQPSVFIAVATPHRAAAFEACRWLIDTLKAEVTIWKKEIWSDGRATWVSSPSSPEL